MVRRLKAKPEALRAQLDRDVALRRAVASDPGTGDVQREHAQRVLNAGIAVLRLKTAADAAKEAHANLVGLVGADHHAARAALATAAQALKAVQLADDVLRVLMR
jgi:hypothetical protein